VLDSLVVHLEATDDLLLFVVLRDGIELDDDLKARISDALRTGLSPRHRPDDIVAVPAIPRTMTGKKLELPVKRILTGSAVADVLSRDALVDPNAIEPFAAYAHARETAG
jgi:Acyl-coenzyme A synthetases/AMP-(fatty) acid ligases